MYGSICLFNGCESVVEAVVGLLRVMTPSARERHASSLMPTRFALEDEDSCGASISGASNGGATFFCQTRLNFEFDLGLTGASFLDLFLFCVQHFKVNHP